MNEQTDVRWKQRFDNLTKAVQTFTRIVAIDHPNEAERMGLIQAFEVVFELSWKTLKDYLNAQGYQTTSPRNVLKTALQDGMIQKGHIWLEALDKRNQTVHTYNDAMAAALDDSIRHIYAPVIDDLYRTLQHKYNDA